MNKQVCRRKQKWKKAYLRLIDSNMVRAMLALLINNREIDNVSTVQRIETKEGENGFLGLSRDII